MRRVIAEGIEPASAFPTGPFPADTVKRLSDSEVEFETPPNEEGMGTQSRLNKNSDPISGLAVLTRRGDLVLLDVRLLPALRGLVSAIVADTREYSGVFPLTDHGQ